jgi:CRISPR-associated protein Cmr4
MYQIAKPLFLICETPLHAGSGSDLGIVDLPIQRERHTDFPKIEGSSLKGALREAVEQKVLKPFRKDASKKLEVRKKLIDLNRVFGHDNGALKGFSKEEMDNLFDTKDKDGKVVKGKTDFAGAIGFTDARLLLFPVKSMKGVFAWVTCKKVLSQFLSDMKQTQEGFDIEGINLIDNSKTYVFNVDTSTKLKTDKVVLEEYTFTFDKDLPLNDAVQVNGNENLPDWLAKHLFNDDGSYWCEKVKKDIIVLSDDDFKDFVNLSTEVITRTKISNETGTVENGALFTEEYLPSESVMYSLVLAHQEFRKDNPFTADEVLDFFGENLNEIIQIGGSATIGKGLVRTGTSFF